MTGLESGKYLIQHAHIHRFWVGVNDSDEPVVPVITDGVHNVLTIEKLEDRKYTISVDQGGRTRYFTPSSPAPDRFVAANTDGPPTAWEIPRLAKGRYVIRIVGWWTEYWTLEDDQKAKEPVGLVRWQGVPTANEEFVFVRLKE